MESLIHSSGENLDLINTKPQKHQEYRLEASITRQIQSEVRFCESDIKKFTVSPDLGFLKYIESLKKLTGLKG